jgi:Cu-Zn family superoxide dismutase
MSAKLTLVAAAGLSMIVAVGCQKDTHSHHDHGAKMAEAPSNARVATATLSASKAAATMPAVKNVAGSVTFTEIKGGIRVTANVTGLEPGKKHGFHIHQKGDLSSPDLNSAGPHFDPEATNKHGGPDHPGHVHAGDFGNLNANDKGMATLTLDVPGLVMTGDKGIVGRSVIVHAKADDLKSQPSGDSGARIAGGVIKLKD